MARTITVKMRTHAIILLATTTSLAAETLTLPLFQIEIPDDWEYSIEAGSDGNWGALVTLMDPDGVGTIKMRSYTAPAVVGEDRLRNMTNVAASTPLSRQSWGDYSGYQYSYSEDGSYYRQWWLSNNQSVIFITHRSNIESGTLEVEEIERVVRSITTVSPETN